MFFDLIIQNEPRFLISKNTQSLSYFRPFFLLLVLFMKMWTDFRHCSLENYKVQTRKQTHGIVWTANWRWPSNGNEENMIYAIIGFKRNSEMSQKWNIRILKILFGSVPAPAAAVINQRRKLTEKYLLIKRYMIDITCIVRKKTQPNAWYLQVR